MTAERSYPEAFDRLASGIQANQAKAQALVEQLEPVDAGLKLLLDGAKLGERAVGNCSIQVGRDLMDNAVAHGYIDDALGIHPGAGSDNPRAAEAHRLIVEGNEELVAEGAGFRSLHASVEGLYRTLAHRVQAISERKNMVTLALKQARVAVSTWHEADEANTAAIAARSIETEVLNGAKQNIANAKEKLQPPEASTTTTEEARTPATAAAKLLEAKLAVDPLPASVHDICVAVGAAFTAYGEADKILTGWDPNVYGPIPPALADVHGRMSMLIAEISFTLNGKKAQEEAEKITQSYEVIDKVAATAAEGRSMIEHAVSHLKDAEESIEPYRKRGYDV